MYITLKNKDIYEYALNAKTFYDSEAEQIYLPAKCCFYLYKNLTVLIDAATYIDKTRQLIIEKFGTRNEDGSYTIPEKDQLIVQNELSDLSNVTQDIDICKISIEELGDLKLSLNHMKALSFMIEDEKNSDEREEGGY